MTSSVMARATTRAMSCSSSVVVLSDRESAAAELGRDGARRLHQLERRWSRFSATSEVSRLNAATGTTLGVSPETVRLVEAMVQAWYATEGAFDPTLLSPLVGLGYSASRDDATKRTSLAPGWDARGRTAEILIDTATGEVRLPPGTVIDPGGIGKGVAADLVADELIAAGATGVLVEVGGDIAVRGAASVSTVWPIAVADPDGPASPRVLELTSGGVATSSTRLRTWSVDGQQRHHLLDPRTLGPTETEVVACTVVAGTAAWAEAFTKLAFIDGAAAALERYESLGLGARVSTTDGSHRHSSAWGAFCR